MSLRIDDGGVSQKSEYDGDGYERSDGIERLDRKQKLGAFVCVKSRISLRKCSAMFNCWNTPGCMNSP